MADLLVNDAWLGNTPPTVTITTSPNHGTIDLDPLSENWIYTPIPSTTARIPSRTSWMMDRATLTPRSCR